MYHILLVDDNEAVCYLFATMFELNNFRVSVATDPQAALEISRDNAIDGIITDFRMPGMNGVELVRKVRDTHPDLPAIVVSGFPHEALGADKKTPVFSKPVNTALLIQRMKDMIVDVRTARKMRPE